MSDTDTNTRNTKLALHRGVKGRCPRCGKGHVFKGYLKVADSCDVCGLDFTPQRADDGPAYFTILFVGHLLVPGLHLAYAFGEPSPAMVAGLLSTLAILLSLILLPRIKGVLINYQWAKQLHGF